MTKIDSSREDILEMTEKLYLATHSEKGRGVFAKVHFATGSEVLRFGGEIFAAETISDYTHYLQIDKDLYLGPSGKIDDYVNHSCDPNCGLRLIGKEVALVAIRDIPANDEITYDYSTATADLGQTSMKCFCGAEDCRKIIGDFRDLPEAIKKRYLALNVVLPFANL
jgi:SET domain-containing protein